MLILQKLLLALLSLGGKVIFARGKFKFKLFLNDLWYEPETLWLFLTFTRDYFAEKEMKKILTFQGGTYFFTGVLSKNRSLDV